MKQYLLISDFDKTLSFNDSGIVLAEMLGIPGFQEKIAGLSNIHLVQQGGELAYLLLHDPEFRRVRKHDLTEVGKRIRLKQNIRQLSRLLDDLDGHHFTFYVVSATIFSERASAITQPAARLSPSIVFRRATARWPFWRNFAQSFPSATIALCMWATEAPTSM
jgi:hypothetical protein